MIKLTKHQQEVVDSDKNIVVIANPGSGKTATIAMKIKEELSKLEDYQGVIAISYTKKASKELKDRVLTSGVDIKRSFFNTIDRFCIEEIIRPFINHVIKRDKNELNIFKVRDIEDFPYTEEQYKTLYKKDRLELSLTYIKEEVIILEDTGLLANYIINKSEACRRYLKSRYKYILIDEYQDCDEEQNNIFLNIKNIGLKAVAVGDINQSIFGYANKSSKYLIDLTKNTDFKTIPLNENFRCHESIVRYAYSFLGINCSTNKIYENRVKIIKVNGSEKEIAEKINLNIYNTMEQYEVEEMCKVGILVRSNRTAEIISSNLTLPHKVYRDTVLDLDSSNWASIFKDLLNCTFNNQINEYEFINKYFNYRYDLKNIEKFRELMMLIRKNIKNDGVEKYFEKIARLIDSENQNIRSIENLKNVLKDKNSMNLYNQTESGELQIMTLHKSKGLEFEIVIHLDLYEFILPRRIKVNNNWILEDEEQCKNLHYVGITRAKKLCILFTSTQRTNSSGRIISANPSEFLI